MVDKALYQTRVGGGDHAGVPRHEAEEVVKPF